MTLNEKDSMSKRTYERNGIRIENASDLDEVVKDKRSVWRASPSKLRRRKRRYEKRLTKELLFNDLNKQQIGSEVDEDS